MPIEVLMLISPRSISIGRARVAMMARATRSTSACGAVGQNDGELVAAQPRQEVAAVQRARDQLRDLAQQFVARGVAHRVVDLLEAVEVEQQQRRLPAVTPALHQHVGDLAVEQRAVGEPGERVEIGQPLQLLLGGFAFRDVLDRAGETDDAALGVGHRLADHREIADRAVAALELDVDAAGPCRCASPPPATPARGRRRRRHASPSPRRAW